MLQTLRNVAEARLGTEVLYELIEVRAGEKGGSQIHTPFFDSL